MSLYRGSETEDSIWRVLSPNHCLTLDNIILFRLFFFSFFNSPTENGEFNLVFQENMLFFLHGKKIKVNF